jgi:hypothetical protein
MWQARLLQFTNGPELSQAATAELLQEVIAAFRASLPPIVALVAALGPYLTNESDLPRTKAIAVFAEVRRLVCLLSTAPLCPPNTWCA